MDQVDAFSLNFGEELNLKLNEVVSFNNLALKTTSVSKPKGSCRDCYEMATLTVKKNTLEKKLEFKVGGFNGVMIDELTAFNYKFILKKVETDGISVAVYEN